MISSPSYHSRVHLAGIDYLTRSHGLDLARKLPTAGPLAARWTICDCRSRRLGVNCPAPETNPRPVRHFGITQLSLTAPPSPFPRPPWRLTSAPFCSLLLTTDYCSLLTAHICSCLNGRTSLPSPHAYYSACLGKSHGSSMELMEKAIVGFVRGIPRSATN